MARYNNVRNNFLAGEVSPKFYGRTDAKEHNQGLKTVENALVYPQGGIGKRPGLQYSFTTVSHTVTGQGTKTATVTDTSVLIPMSFAGVGYLVILTGYVTTYDWGIYVYNTSTGSFLTLNAWDFPIYLFYNTSIKDTPLSADLSKVQYVQDNNKLRLVCYNVPPLDITITSTSTFGIGFRNTLVYGLPYGDYIFNGPSITVSIGGGVWTYTLSGTGFTSAMVGDIYEFIDLSGGSAHSEQIVVTEYINSTTLYADQVSYTVGSSGTLSATAYGSGSTYFYRKCMWGPTVGYPETVAIWSGRNIFGGNTAYPNTLWSTEVFEDDIADTAYGVTLTASSPSKLTISSDGSSRINFLVSGKNLAVGTTGREYICTSLSPLSPDIKAESSEGSSFSQGFRVGSGVLFSHRSKQRLMYSQYNFNEDAFKASDLNIMADHIFKYSHKYFTSFVAPEIKQYAYQSGEEKAIWAIDTNGAVFSLTFNQELGVMAWQRHIIGGVFGTEQAKVTSICVVYNPVTNHDDVWMIVKRTINSSTKYYFEKLGQEFYLDDLYNTATDIRYKPVYCDSAKLVRLGSPGTTFTGLSHLEGQTVQVVADGNYIGEKTISSGNLVLTKSYTEVIVGLKYTMKVEPLVPEVGSVIGQGMGAIRRIDRAVVKFFDTVGAKIGATTGSEYTMEFRPITLPMDEEVPLYNGLQVVEFDGDYDREAKFIITQELPLPCKINYVAIRGLLYD